METTTTYTTEQTVQENKASGSPAIAALAVVGFIALVVLGIVLAIYSARYIPDALSNLFPSITGNGGGNGEAQLGVVSTSTNSLPIEQGTTTVLTTQPQTTNNSYSNSYSPSAQPTYTQSAPAKPRLYGLPNLTTTIIATGYLADGTTASFVASPIVPPGARAAVEFSIANTGTNVSGPWGFTAGIPTHGGYVFTSPTEQPLGPGDHIVFTLGFDQAAPGSNPIVVTADPNNVVMESNEVDNRAQTILNVQ